MATTSGVPTTITPSFSTVSYLTTITLSPATTLHTKCGKFKYDTTLLNNQVYACFSYSNGYGGGVGTINYGPQVQVVLAKTSSAIQILKKHIVVVLFLVQFLLLIVLL
ncbi:hypothetical protein DFJ63DRAFT_313611 [Scheffersomyces coipomensis]|uniref:uncharacterized protein n=1 Tax=Scheffersomyces coipomensis TaxID=1788519 RepID=UPI00315D48E5